MERVAAADGGEGRGVGGRGVSVRRGGVDTEACWGK